MDLPELVYQRDGGIGHLDAPAPLDRARPFDLAQAPAQAGQPLRQAAAVDFELGLAGSARADAAPRASSGADPRQMAPLPGQARLQIGELGDLDLEFARQAVGALGENIEDELGAVDDPEFEFVLQIACLRRRQAVVENDQGGAARVRQLAHLGHFAAADKGARVNFLEGLEDFARDFGARALRQRAKLNERILRGAAVGVAHRHAHQDGAFAVWDGWLICGQGYSLKLN